MKLRDAKKGMLVCRKHGLFWGEITDTSSRGTVVVFSYYDGCRHYINAHKIKELPVVIEPDGDGFHGYVPSLKGIHVPGDTREESYEFLKSAICAYVISMREHSEIALKRNWNDWKIL